MGIVETREGTGLCGHVVIITVQAAPGGKQQTTEPDLCADCEAYMESLPSLTETIFRSNLSEKRYL